MAEAVARALSAADDPAVVAVSAGTGTGKSLAYLVPAVSSGKCVVVATATKALQDQLANKDLPLVARGLGRPVKWAVLKGRSNYLCRQRLHELDRLGEQQRLDAPDASPAATDEGGPRESGSARAVAARRVGEEVRRLAAWADSTTSGDRAELDFEPSNAAWSSVSVTSEECPGARRCPSGHECFAELARAKAAAADIVVVNIHLLGAHLRSGGEVLPEHDALVVDEAHELEDILAACLGVEVGPGRVRVLASAARGALAGAGRRVQRGDDTPAARAVEAVTGSATGFEEALASGEERRLPSGLSGELGDQVTLLVDRLERLGVELRRASDGSGAAGAGSGGGGSAAAGEQGGAPDAAQRCLRALLGVDRCREDLAACLNAGSGEVLWVTGGDRPALRSAPLDVSNTMSAQVFSVMPVVMTSATLPRGLAARLGAPGPSTVELDVGSPFAYKANSLLYSAVSLPDRRRPEAEAAIHNEIEALVLAAGGRTLALFTSRRAMATAAEVLAEQASLAGPRSGRSPEGGATRGAQLAVGCVPVRNDELLAGGRRSGTGAHPGRDRQDSFPTSGRAAQCRSAASGRQGGLPDRRPPAGGDASRPGRRAADPDRHGPRRRRRARPSAGACLVRADAGEGAPSDAPDAEPWRGRGVPSGDPRRGG